MLNLGLAMMYPGKKKLQRKKLVCIGDSQTGYIEIAIQECSDEHNWVNQVARSLNMQVVQSGISGHTSSMMLARFNSDVIAHHPDFCIIEQGGNDVYNNFPLSTTISNMTQMVQLCRDNNIQPLIMNCNPQFNCAKFYEVHGITPVVQWEEAGKLPAIRAWEKQYCTDNNIPLIDVYTPFLTSPTSQDLSLYCRYDQVHPSVKGYQYITRAVVDTLLPLLD